MRVGYAVPTVDLRTTHTVLFKKFAHFYDAGVPLTQALETAARDLPAGVKEAVDGITNEIYRGSSLAEAFAQRPELFGEDVVDLLRVGERRGDLSTAARSIASGLEELVLAATRVNHAELDALLRKVEGGGILHLEQDSAADKGRIRVRDGDRLRPEGETDIRELIPSLMERARIGAAGGQGVFLWEQRIVRAAVLTGTQASSAVVRVSGPLPPPPRELGAWLKGPPTVMCVAGPVRGDKDAVLWSVVKALAEADAKVVSVGLPVPETLEADDLEAAVAQDPDVLCIARVRGRDQVQELGRWVAAGLPAVCGIDAGSAEAARRQLQVWILRDLVGPVLEVGGHDVIQRRKRNKNSRPKRG